MLFFKSQMSPLYLLIIVFPTFEPLTATLIDGFISQNVKFFLAYTEQAESSLAYTETKWNQTLAYTEYKRNQL